MLMNTHDMNRDKALMLRVYVGIGAHFSSFIFQI